MAGQHSFGVARCDSDGVIQIYCPNMFLPPEVNYFSNNFMNKDHSLLDGAKYNVDIQVCLFKFFLSQATLFS